MNNQNCYSNVENNKINNPNYNKNFNNRLNQSSFDYNPYQQMPIQERVGRQENACNYNQNFNSQNLNNQNLNKYNNDNTYKSEEDRSQFSITNNSGLDYILKKKGTRRDANYQSEDNNLTEDFTVKQSDDITTNITKLYELEKYKLNIQQIYKKVVVHISSSIKANDENVFNFTVNLDSFNLGYKFDNVVNVNVIKATIPKYNYLLDTDDSNYNHELNFFRDSYTTSSTITYKDGTYNSLKDFNDRDGVSDYSYELDHTSYENLATISHTSLNIGINYITNQLAYVLGFTDMISNEDAKNKEEFGKYKKIYGNHLILGKKITIDTFDYIVPISSTDNTIDDFLKKINTLISSSGIEIKYDNDHYHFYYYSSNKKTVKFYNDLEIRLGFGNPKLDTKNTGFKYNGQLRYPLLTKDITAPGGEESTNNPTKNKRVTAGNHIRYYENLFAFISLKNGSGKELLDDKHSTHVLYKTDDGTHKSFRTIQTINLNAKSFDANDYGHDTDVDINKHLVHFRATECELTRELFNESMSMHKIKIQLLNETGGFYNCQSDWSATFEFDMLDSNIDNTIISKIKNKDLKYLKQN